jgi:hypothetical protein
MRRIAPVRVRTQPYLCEANQCSTTLRGDEFDEWHRSKALALKDTQQFLGMFFRRRLRPQRLAHPRQLFAIPDPRNPNYCTHAPNLSAARAFAFAASSSRFFGGAVVSRERSSLLEMPTTSSTAAENASSFALDGLLNPLIFLTNCREAARTSSSVTGGSKLNSVLMFLHTGEISSVIGWLSILKLAELKPNCATNRQVCAKSVKRDP